MKKGKNEARYKIPIHVAEKMPLLDFDGKLIRQSLLMPLKMTGHRKWIRFFKLRRQGFCESHFDELFKRSFAFVDPRANQSAFPAIQNDAASVLAGRSLEICPSACASTMTFAIIADQVENPLETRARIISLCSESSAPKLPNRQPPQNSFFSAT